MSEQKTTKKLRCPVCNSLLIYIRKSTDEIICRSCGKESKINEGVNKESGGD